MASSQAACRSGREVALVVGGAAREDAAVADLRRKRRAGPQVERLGALDVVVAVDQDRGRIVAGRCPQLADHQRVAAIDRDQLGLPARVAHLRGGPLGGAPQVLEVAAARGDAGDAQPVEELVEQGIGHPGSLGSRRLSRLYTDESVSAGPSLYRRHRPRTFADVIGQEHVVRTLRHAIERDSVHLAYPVRRLARDGQDVDGQDARRGA